LKRRRRELHAGRPSLASRHHPDGEVLNGDEQPDFAGAVLLGELGDFAFRRGRADIDVSAVASREMGDRDPPATTSETAAAVRSAG